MPECILCQSNDHKTDFSLNDQYGDAYQLNRCLNCGCHYLDPQPSLSQLNRAYAESYYGGGEKKFNPVVEKVLDHFRVARARMIAKKLTLGSKILDIGCGNGDLLQQLSQEGDFDLYGLEIPGKAAERSAKRESFQLSLGELQSDSFPFRHFDCITLIHVFEHLPNPANTISILSEILKPGGRLIIEQPNIESWQAQIFKGKWLHLDPPRHLNLMGPKVLKKLLSNHGFYCDDESYFSPQFSPFGVQQSILNLFCKKREVLYEHLKGNHEYVKDYSALSLFSMKLFHWVTFPLFVITDLIASAFRRGGTMKMEFILRERD